MKKYKSEIIAKHWKEAWAQLEAERAYEAAVQASLSKRGAA